MREDPGLDVGKISACLEAHYGLRVAYVAFLTVGFDPNAAAYEAVSREGETYFLKVRFGPVDSSGLLVPRALIDLGVPNIVAPCGRYPMASGARSTVTQVTASSSTRSSAARAR